jgi:hypothetical protein
MLVSLKFESRESLIKSSRAISRASSVAGIRLSSVSRGGGGRLVGGVRCLFCLGLSLEMGISVLFEHVNHRIPGPTESKTCILVKVSGVEPPLSCGPYNLWPCLGWRCYWNRCCALFRICALTGPGVCISCGFDGCQSVQHRLFRTDSNLLLIGLSIPGYGWFWCCVWRGAC